MRRPLAAVAASLLVLAACMASTASASSSLRIGIFDDGMVLYGEPDRVFPQLANTGARLVRVNLWWSGPGIRVATRRPQRPADPTDPAYNWDTYDRTVRFAIVNGMQPVFSILGTPPWANAAKGWNVAPTNARDLRLFAAAAQRRYSGTFVNADGVTLPRVSLWMAWNEPNNPVFLKPQYRRTGTTWTIQSGRDYAKMCNAIVQGIKSIQRDIQGRVRWHRAAREQQPELEPPVGLAAPVPARDEGGRRREVSTPTPITRTTSSPAETPTTKPAGVRGQPPTAITLGNFDMLVTELNRLYRKRVRMWITEYGYQTNPPDRISGVTYSKQAAYMTQAVSYARRHPQIDLFLWFLLRDEDRLDGWQSGLTTVTGARKPSFNTFRRAALG